VRVVLRVRLGATLSGMPVEPMAGYTSTVCVPLGTVHDVGPPPVDVLPPQPARSTAATPTTANFARCMLCTPLLDAERTEQ